MIYGAPYRWLDTLAPAPQTAPGVIWRLYWHWPEARALYLFALTAFVFATLASGKYFEPRAYLGAPNYAPIELLVFIPLLYLGFLSGAPQGGFGATAGRALDVLPVPQRALRDAVWFIDVPMGPLVVIFAALLVFLPLAAALPSGYRVWWGVATLVVCAAYAAGRAMQSLMMATRLQGPATGLKSRLAERVDRVLQAATFLCFFSLILAKDKPAATWVMATVSVFAVAWSWLRRPAMAAARGQGEARRKRTTTAFSRPTWQFALLFTMPLLANAAMLILFLVMFAYILGEEVWSSFPASALLQPAIIAGFSGGSFLGMRIRAMRALPISTRGLTAAVLAIGALSALPMFLALWIFDTAGTGGLDTALLALALAAGMAAMHTGGLWITFYPVPGFVGFIVTIFAITVIGLPLMYQEEERTAMRVASIGLGLALAAFAPIAYTNYRHFWWNAKVYRHQFPQANPAAAAVVVSARGEGLLLAAAVIVGFAALACGIFWLA